MQKFSTCTLAAKLTAVALILLAGVSFGSCSKGKHWKEEERRASNEMLRDWRHLVYLNALSEQEFELFANRVTDALERKYPSYVEFVEMPMMGDSVEMVVIATIVNEIKASPDRMQNIFPYHTLVEAGVLPDGMTTQELSDFYRCFSEKINRAYGSIQQFLWDAIYSELDDYLIAYLMSQCAAPYWQAESETVVIMEEN